LCRYKRGLSLIVAVCLLVEGGDVQQVRETEGQAVVRGSTAAVHRTTVRLSAGENQASEGDPLERRGTTDLRGRRRAVERPHRQPCRREHRLIRRLTRQHETSADDTRFGNHRRKHNDDLRQAFRSKRAIPYFFPAHDE